MAPLTTSEMLALARPGAALLSPDSSHAVVAVSEFNFEAAAGAGRTEKRLYLLNHDTAEPCEPILLLSGLSYTEFAWLDSNSVVYLRPPQGEAQLHALDRSDLKQRALLKDTVGVELWSCDVFTLATNKIASLPVVVSNLKTHYTANSTIIAFSALVFPDGDIYAVAAHKVRLEQEARGSDVRVYDALYTRHWDEWKPTAGELTQLHFVQCEREPAVPTIEGDIDGFEIVGLGNWRLEERSCTDDAGTVSLRALVHSPLAGTRYECPVGPFGSAADYSLSSTHLLFHAKSLHLNPATHTRTQVYTIPLYPRSATDSFAQITVGTQGACANPTFSVDGTRIAWLEMREDGYEADRHRIMIFELESSKRWEINTSAWDHSPSALVWCPCGAKIFVTAEDHGHSKLYQIPVPLDGYKSTAEVTPQGLTSLHTVNGVAPIGTTQLLLTISSFVSPNAFFVLDLASQQLSSIASFTPDLIKAHGLDVGHEFTFEGAEGRNSVSGFVLFPPGYDAESEKTYPLAFLVHGGPQGAWTDSFSTRWNPNMYTAAGYITVAINPLGSTGYGQKFCDDIRNNWGGAFLDLVEGLNYVKENYPIDEKRMAMLGASYGGFMANWIQGHNDVTKFAAIVCHDGVFSTAETFFATDELYFPTRDFGGVPWEAKENYEKWSPINHIQNWSTPQLVIHGGQDFRLPVTQGLGVFNTLQKLGIPSRFVYFESENHWILNPHNGIRWHEEVFKWIDQWTAAKQESA